MTNLSPVFAILLLLSLSCKKSTMQLPPGEIHKTLIYKFVATVPSSTDSLRGIFADSLSLSTSTTSSDPAYLKNFDGVSTYLSPYGGSYFSIKYDNENSRSPYFYFSNSVFQHIPENPEVNKLYISDYGATLYPPIVVGQNDGTGKKIYYLEDGEEVDTLAKYSAFNHTEMKFTHIETYKLPVETKPFRIVDGEFTGYRTISLNTNPTKVIRRIDFTVRFSGLLVDRSE